MRAYNAVLDRWELVSMNQCDGLQNSGTGHFENSEMHLEQKLDPEGGLLRIRYYDITPDHFLWNADQSRDGGNAFCSD